MHAAHSNLAVLQVTSSKDHELCTTRFCLSLVFHPKSGRTWKCRNPACFDAGECIMPTGLVSQRHDDQQSRKEGNMNGMNTTHEEERGALITGLLANSYERTNAIKRRGGFPRSRCSGVALSARFVFWSNFRV